MMKVFCIIFCFLVVLTSCSHKSVIDPDEQTFIDTISAVIPNVKGMPVPYDTVGDMISGSKCDIIVRGRLTSRGECGAVGNMIITPYTVEVDECYLGGIENGGTFTLGASYGIIDGRQYRADPHPILVTGSEYIMFVKCDRIGGEMSYYLASGTSGALRIDGDEVVNDTGFDAFGGTVDAVVGQIRAAVE